MSMLDAAHLGVGASGTSGTTVTVTTSSAIVAGNFALLGVVGDNITTTDGVTTDHSSVTDTGGAVSWTKLYEYTNGEGGAAAGVTVSLWRRPIQGSDLASGQSITVTFASAITDKTASGRIFSTGVLPTLAAAAVGGLVDAANDFGSLAFSGLPSKEYLYFRLCGKEANVASTSDITPSSGFSTITAQRSRNNADSVCVRGEWKIATGTGETSNPTFAFSGDASSIFVVLEEVTATAGKVDEATWGGVGRGVGCGIG